MEQPEVKWPEVTSFTWPEVTLVTCPVRKYVVRMRNRKLRYIHPNGIFRPEVTSVTWPADVLSVSGTYRKYVLRMPGFFRRFFLSSSNMATEGHLTPSGFPWVYATGSCATTVVTEGNVTPFGSVHGVFSTTPASYIQHGHRNYPPASYI